jgi:hypothetical protein
MLDYFTPEDKETDDTDYHKLVRTQTQDPAETADDKDFTRQEIRNAVESMGNKKAPEDCITSEIYKISFENFPTYVTAMYNGCLKRGIFPLRWKRARLIPITKPRKENSKEISKYRPISLLNIGRKVLEKGLINRIIITFFSNNLMNNNQYGFTPQRGTTDATMAVKDFVETGLVA